MKRPQRPRATTISSLTVGGDAQYVTDVAASICEAGHRIVSIQSTRSNEWVVFAEVPSGLEIDQLLRHVRGTVEARQKVRALQAQQRATEQAPG